MITLLADAYFHSMDPFVIQFTKSFGIRWYGMAYIAGFLCCWFLLRRMAKTKRSPLSVEAAGDLIFYVIFGVLVGGRLGYAVFYDPHLFIGFNKSLLFWDILAINKGGMASHGGMIGVIVAVWLFSRRHKVSMLHLLDMCSLFSTFGLFFGRIANFINGELLGRVMPDQVNPPPWSVKFPQEMSEWVVGNAESVDDLLAWDSSRLESLKDAVKFLDISSGQWLANIQALKHASLENAGNAALPLNQAINSLILDTQQKNQGVIDAITPHLTAFYPSQLFQALTDGPILGGILALIWLRPRRPGTIGCFFLIVYGILRISTEFFRQPDEGVALLLGFSRGQVLSFAMIAAGTVILWLLKKKNAAPMGGLLRPVADHAG